MARRTRKEALETREKLIESALEVMSEKPFSNVSMNEIAEKIGLSKGAAYWHFKNKTDVLINLVESLCKEEEEKLMAGSADLVSRNALKGFFREKMTRAVSSERYKRITMLMQRKIEWPEDVREKIFSMVKAFAETERKMIDRFLSNLQMDGDIRGDISTEDLSAVIMAIFHGLLFFQLSGIFMIDLLKQTDFIFDAFEGELRPGKTDIKKEQVR
jgi:TetR/AcrR family acrAB operon transcriptional repressor